jgi:hypothetical protein
MAKIISRKQDTANYTTKHRELITENTGFDVAEVMRNKINGWSVSDFSLFAVGRWMIIALRDETRSAAPCFVWTGDQDAQSYLITP